MALEPIAVCVEGCEFLHQVAAAVAQILLDEPHCLHHRLRGHRLAALAQTTQNELGDVATAQRQRLHRRSQHVALRLHRREREGLPRG